MPTTKPKLSIAEASARLLAREYPSLDEVILCRIEFAVGKHLAQHRADIESSDETVKTALIGGRYAECGDVLSAAEVHSLGCQISPGYHPSGDDIDIVMKKLSELLEGSDLREELTSLGLAFVGYQKSRHDKDGDWALGISRQR